MKKLFYSFAILTLIFTSCNPMEDIYNEIDAQETVIVGDVSFTLTDDNYTEDLELSYKNFGSIAEAKTMISTLLAKTFPVWGKSSIANVTFKYYNKVSTYSSNVEKVSKGDYITIKGAGKTNFNSSGDIYKYLDLKYPTPSEGDFVSISYKLVNSGVENTVVDGFAYTDGSWNIIVGFTKDQYTLMGGRFPNFSSHDEADIKIPVALLDRHKFSPQSPKTIVPVMYEIYKSGVTKSYVNNYIFDVNSWSKYNNILEETIKFGHDGSLWVPDNTIKYTLTNADYALVGNGIYNNFDVRPGRDEETTEARLAKINTILLKNFPDDEDGQKYIVSYNIYNGAAAVWKMSLIKTGEAYVLQ